MVVMLGTLAGLVIVLLGLAIFPLPIPLGAILVFIGLVILVTVNPAVATLVKRMRRRSKKFDAFLRRTEKALPQSVRDKLHDDPSLDPDDRRSKS